jgi:hypothetical protein
MLNQRCLPIADILLDRIQNPNVAWNESSRDEFSDEDECGSVLDDLDFEFELDDSELEDAFPSKWEDVSRHTHSILRRSPSYADIPTETVRIEVARCTILGRDIRAKTFVKVIIQHAPPVEKVLFIHHIYTSNEHTVLSVSRYIWAKGYFSTYAEMAHHLPEDETAQDKLLLCYKDSNAMGQSPDAEDISVSLIREISIDKLSVQHCTIVGPAHRRTYPATNIRCGWAISVVSSQHQVSVIPLASHLLEGEDGYPFAHSERIQLRQPCVVDLFSGAGGSSAGFAAAGFQICVGVEKNRLAAATWKVRNIGEKFGTPLIFTVF